MIATMIATDNQKFNHNKICDKQSPVQSQWWSWQTIQSSIVKIYHMNDHTMDCDDDLNDDWKINHDNSCIWTMKNMTAMRLHNNSINAMRSHNNYIDMTIIAQ